MARIYLLGRGSPGTGVVTIQGDKNDFINLAPIAALARGGMTFSGVPDITDAHSVMETFRSVGGLVVKADSSVTFDPTRISTGRIGGNIRPYRTSITHVAALAALRGDAEGALPGGDPLGGRVWDIQMRVLKEAGAEVMVNSERVFIRFRRGAPKPFHVSLRGRQGHGSVGGSITALILAAKANGTSELKYLSRSPIVTHCIELLQKLGVEIHQSADDSCRVTSPRELATERIEVVVAPDVSAATMYALAGVLRSEKPVHLSGISKGSFPKPVTDYFDVHGIHMSESDCVSGVEITRDQLAKNQHTSLVTDSDTTDIAPLLLAHAALSPGGLSVIETVHKSRTSIAGVMNRLGLDVSTTELPSTIEVGGGQSPCTGGSKKIIFAEDIRCAGAAIVLASRFQDNVIMIDPDEHMRRGYEDLSARMTELGIRVVETHDFTPTRSRNPTTGLGNKTF